MFNARRGGLSVAVLYWRVEKTRRRTLELAAGLGTRRTAVRRPQPLGSCCSLLFSRTGRTCVKVVALCGSILWKICCVPCDSRPRTPRRTDPSARLSHTHAPGAHQRDRFQAGVFQSGQPFGHAPPFCCISRKLVQTAVFPPLRGSVVFQAGLEPWASARHGKELVQDWWFWFVCLLFFLKKI